MTMFDDDLEFYCAGWLIGDHMIMDYVEHWLIVIGINWYIIYILIGDHLSWMVNNSEPEWWFVMIYHDWSRLTDWLIDRSIDWLIDWLITIMPLFQSTAEPSADRLRDINRMMSQSLFLLELYAIIIEWCLLMNYSHDIKYHVNNSSVKHHSIMMAYNFMIDYMAKCNCTMVFFKLNSWNYTTSRIAFGLLITVWYYPPYTQSLLVIIKYILWTWL